MKSFLISEADLLQLLDMQQTLAKIITSVQSLKNTPQSDVPFIRQGDYVGLAIELWAREKATLPGVTEFPTIRQLADAWSDRLGWPVEEKSLAKQLNKVRFTYDSDIAKRVENYTKGTVSFV